MITSIEAAMETDQHISTTPSTTPWRLAPITYPQGDGTPMEAPMSAGIGWVMIIFAGALFVLLVALDITSLIRSFHIGCKNFRKGLTTIRTSVMQNERMAEATMKLRVLVAFKGRARRRRSGGDIEEGEGEGGQAGVSML